MAYIDGFVLAVPAANRQAFIEHARIADAMIKECGATRILECWADDVPEGKLTDFRKAVQARDDETVVFSWIEWPDKAARDKGMKQLHNLAETDERFDEEKYPVPFDGKRMIFGGFEPILEV